MSPSAFIPFCEFGGDMSAMGIKIENFSIPVCNSFQAKMLNDQICFEIDLNKYATGNVEKKLKSGFAFLMDYNEDRQIVFNKINETILDKRFGLVSSIVSSDQEQSAFIYLHTIGKREKLLFFNLIKMYCYRACCTCWRGSVQS